MLKSEQVLICEGIEPTPMYHFSMNVCMLLLCVHMLPGPYNYLQGLQRHGCLFVVVALEMKGCLKNGVYCSLLHCPLINRVPPVIFKGLLIPKCIKIQFVHTISTCSGRDWYVRFKHNGN